MVEQGKVGLDQDLGDVLPELANRPVLEGWDADGKPRLRPAKGAITLRQLLTHTAGLSYGFDPNDPLDRAYQKAKVWESESLAEMAEKVAGLPLAYQPGTKWKYSMAMDIQGAMIERWTGQSLPDFYRTRIFEPLGMVDTAFHTPPEKRARLAKLYRFSPTQKKLVEAPSILGRDYETPPKLGNGGGGLVSTAADYARFAQMLLNGGELDGKRIVSAAALKTQMTNHLPDEILKGGYGIGLQQMRPGYGHGYDGAVFCDPAAAGVPVGEGTYQWDGAAGTWFWVDPVHDLLYVGLIQRFAENSPALQKTTQTMMADAYLD